MGFDVFCILCYKMFCFIGLWVFFKIMSMLKSGGVVGRFCLGCIKNDLAVRDADMIFKMGIMVLVRGSSGRK